MTEKEIVCRVADRILTIVVLDDDKELVPMKSAVAYRKSLSYDRDKGEVVVRFARMGKADMVDKWRGRCLRWLQWLVYIEGGERGLGKDCSLFF